MFSAPYIRLSTAAAILLSGGLMSVGSTVFAADARPHPKVITFENTGKDIQPLLSGPPETVNMKSGYVTLAPGKSVGRHSTEQHEEMLVILAGQGEMIFKDGARLKIAANQALYCPPETEHDVRNTGTEPLRYVYIVANAK